MRRILPAIPSSVSRRSSPLFGFAPEDTKEAGVVVHLPGVEQLPRKTRKPRVRSFETALARPKMRVVLGRVGWGSVLEPDLARMRIAENLRTRADMSNIRVRAEFGSEAIAKGILATDDLVNDAGPESPSSTRRGGAASANQPVVPEENVESLPATWPH